MYMCMYIYIYIYIYIYVHTYTLDYTYVSLYVDAVYVFMVQTPGSTHVCPSNVSISTFIVYAVQVQLHKQQTIAVTIGV